jgi:thiazole/oxazole-forming peptide maturase SagD family component
MISVTFLNGNPGALPFCEELLARLSLPGPGPSITIAFSMAEIASLQEKIQRPTLLAIAKNGFLALGPLYEPGKSVCFSCLHHWLATAHEGRDFASDWPAQAEASAAAELINNAFEMDSFNDPRWHYTLHSFDLVKQRHATNPIFSLRDCKACSMTAIPEEWGLRIHCGLLTGIVQKMQITRTRTAGAYRAIGTWRSPLPVRDARPLLRSQESHGRGRTREEAEQGCIGEALERYSLVYRGDEPLQRGRLSDVGGLDPRDILLYSEQQYQTREEWNRLADERYFVGERFDPEQEMDWFPGVDLVDGSRKLLPAACVLMWYEFSAGESEYARGDSIGCGSGRTLDDALAHALLEWIERDAMAIWWYNRIRRPAVNLESFAMPELLQVKDDLHRIGRDLYLLDCTTDFGIPTYVSVAPRLDGTELLFAGASHISPQVAAWKAASEVGQLWFSAVHQKAVDVELKPWLTKSIDTEIHLSPSHEIQAPPEPPPLSSTDQVRVIVDRLKAAGLQAYAADLSRADVILKTARAIVPGLRHIWNRRGPGRLYDVPVRLGWLDRPLTEAQLNSICCMI